MADLPPPNLRSLSILDTKKFLEHGASSGRIDEVVNDNVTVSAIPDGSGGTQWEARTADGKTLRMFGLTIEPALAAVPVVLPAGPGFVYVCYEDENLQKSWCLHIRTD